MQLNQEQLKNDNRKRNYTVTSSFGSQITLPSRTEKEAIDAFSKMTDEWVGLYSGKDDTLSQIASRPLHLESKQSDLINYPYRDEYFALNLRVDRKKLYRFRTGNQQSRKILNENEDFVYYKTNIRYSESAVQKVREYLNG